MHPPIVLCFGSKEKREKLKKEERRGNKEAGGRERKILKHGKGERKRHTRQGPSRGNLSLVWYNQIPLQVSRAKLNGCSSPSCLV